MATVYRKHVVESTKRLTCEGSGKPVVDDKGRALAYCQDCGRYVFVEVRTTPKEAL